MAQVELHPLCTLFPRMIGAEYIALRDDIAANGLRQPIVLHDGMILDGGNRYRACNDSGVEPTFTKFAGPSASAFVLSANMHRRHLSASQQAAIVATVQDWAKAHSPGRASQSVQKNTLDTTKARAEQSGASIMTQRRADAVAKASPEVAKQVAHGTKTLSEAVREVAPQFAPKPAKSAPTIESLQTENADLREQLEAAQQNARELADMLEGFSTADEGAKQAAKEIATLKGLIRTVETQRNALMTTNNELKREIKTKQSQIAKLEKAGAK